MFIGINEVKRIVLMFRKSQIVRCDVIFQPLPRLSEICQELGCKNVLNRTSPIDKGINRINKFAEISCI